MAPAPSTPSRRVRTSARPRPRTLSTRDSSPPPKKRRYIPGGPGGGGRYVDSSTGLETPVGGTGPGGYNYMGPRGRVGRMNAERAGITPLATTPASPHTRPRRDRTDRRRRDRARSTERLSVGPRSSSATAAAAVVAQNNDGYKPREERGWEEFHPELDIDAEFIIFSAEQVDGIGPLNTVPVTPFVQTNGIQPETPENTNALDLASPIASFHGSPTFETSPAIQGDDVYSPNGIPNSLSFTPRKRAGRPVRRGDSMLSGLGSPPAPRIQPLAMHNPKERLNLPRPNYRQIDTFAMYEQDHSVAVNYVDRTMSAVGYQESDLFTPPARRYIRVAEGSIEEDLDLAVAMAETDDQAAPAVGRVEYDMDEQDDHWLEAHNLLRKSEGVDAIKPAFFEVTMTQIEKEWHSLEKRMPKPNPKPPQTHRPRSSSAAAVNGENIVDGEEQDSKCAVCDDGDCENTNAIVFCDGCDLAVHQECYGVPFIPEGQWLCRKCKDRANPMCMFCPNPDGAFKHTSNNKWAHLLCAIWIPELTIGNTTFMEPVQDVERVPRSRYKLLCYICQQSMGACIQCGNKNCYQAFHVTCARRARLFLRMKSAHASGIQDASVLKAFCHKHVPNDWRRQNDVDWAFREATLFYKRHFGNRKWNMSAQAVSNNDDAGDAAGDDASSGTKRKRGPQKQVWRLPSGAPVVPQGVYHNVEIALTRFAIRKRKEFVAEACKYWTLKREARRGAALLKRLQMQMDSFSSMEITRRNFAGMGAAGGPKLQRRIEFAGDLEKDMSQIQAMCEMLKEREEKKLEDVQHLREIIDTVYFPIPPLLWPIFSKAQDLDPKNVFTDGFREIEVRLTERQYTSVATFSADIAAVFGSTIGVAISNASVATHELDQSIAHSSLTPEQKEKKKLAKRIIKAIQGPLDDAAKKEADLGLKPHQQELADLDAMLDQSIMLRRQSAMISAAGDTEGGSVKSLPNGHVLAETIEEHPDPMDTDVINPVAPNGQDNTLKQQVYSHPSPPLTNGHVAKSENEIPPTNLDETTDEAIIHLQLHPDSSTTVPLTSAATTEANLAAINANPDMPQVNGSAGSAPPLSHSSSTNTAPSHPPSIPADDISTKSTDLLAALRSGGIPWYAEVFEPKGTTLWEERWTGREVLRDMSEELTDMDEDELNGLGGDEEMVDVDGSAEVASTVSGSVDAGEKSKTRPKKKKRARGW